MIVTEFGDRDIVVGWSHITAPKAEESGEQRGTICFIKEGAKGSKSEDMQKIVEVRTVLNHKDNYDKAIGRKLSLARALNAADYDKNTRQVIWNSYRQLTVK